DGLLRHAAFLRRRTDKRAHECERQGWSSPAIVSSVNANEIAEAKGRIVRERVHVDASAVHEPPPPPARAPIEKKIAFSNLNKVFWPAEKYTKGDMIEYYRAVSKWLLPYLVNRPVVLTRSPDGI